MSVGVGKYVDDGFQMSVDRSVMYLLFSLLLLLSAASCYRLPCGVRVKESFSPLYSSQDDANKTPSTMREGLVAQSMQVLSLGLALLAGSQRTRAAADTRPVITGRAYIDIKIANYTEESVGTNQGASGSGRIVVGLYGQDSPMNVKLFLDTINGKDDRENQPSFMNAQFMKISNNGGLLEIERVRGVNTVKIAGSTQYEYNGNILTGYRQFIERNSLRHDRKYLLSRNQLVATPEFGITLADAVPSIDAFNCVFGEVLSGFEVLEAISRIPLYSYKTKTGYGGSSRGVESDFADQVG